MVILCVFGLFLSLIGIVSEIPAISMIGGIIFIAGGWLKILIPSKSKTADKTGRIVEGKTDAKTEVPMSVKLVDSAIEVINSEKPTENCCRNCGAKVEESDIFCIECGFLLKNQ